MKIRVFQKGFNYSQDGPGNRLVYHLQGCNMRCPWCSNPEGVNPNGTLIVNYDLLVDSVCPHGAIYETQLDRARCEACSTKECVNQKKNLGIRKSYAEYDINSIIDEVRRSSPLFFGGGGVTLSGGEATVQFEGVKIILEKLHDAGINTAIETNGTHRKLKKLFPSLDFLIMDFKHYDDELHTKVTGLSNTVIKENLKRAFAEHHNVLVRIPLIKKFNDSERDVNGFLEFITRCDTKNATFEFLPYHEYGRTKWHQCGMAYQMDGAFINEETLDQYKNEFIANGLKVVET